MKKRSLMAAGILALILTGCGGNASNDAPPEAQSETQSEAQAETQAGEADGDTDTSSEDTDAVLAELEEMTGGNTTEAGAESSTEEASQEQEGAAQASDEGTVSEASQTEEAQSSDDSSKAAGKLPAYEYPGPEQFYYVVYKYVVDECGKWFEDGEVIIPCIQEVYLDDSNKDDILMYGDFEVYRYDLEGDTLMCRSGGSFPGVIHIKYDDGDYTVTKMEVLEDGSKSDQSAKKIFGKHYDECMKVISDEKLREKTRAQIIANYVAANNLDITQYQDYGWDPVKLPEENIDSFYSVLN